MIGKRILFVVMLAVIAAVFLVSCNAFSPETRAEVLTQQNCLRGCIDRCPQEMARYETCAANCGHLCKAAGQQQQPQSR
jgi:hypothetical protein